MVGYRLVRDDELYHYGVKGMKWGVRRYQNKDGSYTDLGKKKYNKSGKRSTRELETMDPNEVYNLVLTKFGRMYAGKKSKHQSENFKKALKMKDDFEKKYEEAEREHSITFSLAGNYVSDYIQQRYASKYGLPYAMRKDVFSKMTQKEYHDAREAAMETPAYKAIWGEFEKKYGKLYSSRHQEERKMNSDIIGLALDDIGFEDTKEAREYMSAMMLVFDD